MKIQNFWDIMLSEISHSHKRTNTLQFHSYEVSKVVKTIKTDSRHVVAKGWGHRAGEIIV